MHRTHAQVVYVLQADDSGSIVTPLPGAPGGPPLSRTVDWLLVDGMTVRVQLLMTAAISTTRSA